MSRRTQMLCYCALLCALIIVSTFLFRFTIPGTDVMVTLQVFFVLLCGQLLPVKHCLYTTGAYVLAGLLGLPVFASLSGIGVVFTPSFGYLLAFPAAAMVCSWVRSKQNKGSRYWASFAGIVVMYLLATGYILFLKGVYLPEALSVEAALTSYVLVFLPLDAVKGAAAAWLGQRLGRLLFRQL